METTSAVEGHATRGTRRKRWPAVRRRRTVPSHVDFARGELEVTGVSGARRSQARGPWHRPGPHGERRRTTERRAVAGRWPASPRKLAVTVRRRLAPMGGTTDAVQRPARMGTTTRRTPRPRRTVSAIVPTVERATRPLTTSAQRAPWRQRRGVTLEIRSAPTARCAGGAPVVGVGVGSVPGDVAPGPGAGSAADAGGSPAMVNVTGWVVAVLPAASACVAWAL